MAFGGGCGEERVRASFRDLNDSGIVRIIEILAHVKIESSKSQTENLRDSNPAK